MPVAAMAFPIAWCKSAFAGQAELVMQAATCFLTRQLLGTIQQVYTKSRKLFGCQHTSQQIVHVLDASRDAHQVVWKAPCRSHLMWCQ
jgi:hypothetical protein